MADACIRSAKCFAAWTKERAAGLGSNLKVYSSIISSSPSILIAPLLVLGLVVGLGTWAVLIVSDKEEDDLRSKAEGLAVTAAAGMTALITEVYQPVVTLGAVLQYSAAHWDWEAFQPSFEPLAKMLFDYAPAGYITAITVRPNAGTVRAVYPANASYIASDILNDPMFRNSTLALIEGRTMSADRSAASAKQLKMRVPLFVANVSADETFGLPPLVGCPIDLCYINATRSKFWGLTSATIDLSQISSLDNLYLRQLVASSYRLSLVKVPSVPDSAIDFMSAPLLIASTPQLPGDGAARAMVNIPGASWVLSIEPEAGWKTSWATPAIAVIVVFAVAAALLLLLLVISRREHQLLVTALVPQCVINKAKCEEDFVLGLKEKSKMNLSDSGTPAEIILQMVNCLLHGGKVTTQELVLVKHALLDGANLYEPRNLAERMGAALDSDVKLALMKTLGQAAAVQRNNEVYVSSGHLVDSLCDYGSKALVPRRSINALETSSSSFTDFSTMKSSLQAILAYGNELLADGAVRRHSGPSSRHSSSATILAASPSPLIQDGVISIYDTAASSTYILGPAGPDSGSKLGAALGSGQPASRRMSSMFEAVARRPPRSPLVEEVEAVLATATTTWAFDAFELDRVSQGHGLSTLGFFLIQKAGLLHQHKSSPQALARYLCAIEAGYKANPYHNSMHAASVVHAMHMMLTHGGLIPGYADPLTQLGCYMAAIVHDYEHRGLTNDFLINSCDPLATVYNDRSPMENHHLAAAFELLWQPGHDFVSNMTKTNRATLRKLVIDLVLATDMKQHFATTSQFSNVHMAVLSEADTPGSSATPPRRRDTHSRCGGMRAAEVSLSSGDTCQSSRSIVPLDDAEKLLSLQMALKCADLSHLFNDLSTHLQWVGCLEAEFFQQGDREKAAGLPVSPLFDRDKPGVSKSQVGFYSFVAVPMFRNFTNVFRGAEPAYGSLLANLDYWRKVEEDAKQTSGPGHGMKEAGVRATATTPRSQRSHLDLTAVMAPVATRPNQAPAATLPLVRVSLERGTTARVSTAGLEQQDVQGV